MSDGVNRTLMIIEDNDGDVRLFREMFNEQGPHNTVLVHMNTMAQAEAHLADHGVDIILLDLGLPDVQGLAAVRRARAAAPNVPLVVLTGMDDESLATQTLQEGAQDYLIKGQIEARGLLRALRYAVERKTMEATSLALTLKIAHSVGHDFLTGLPNRVLLNDRISVSTALASRHGRKIGVLFVDLDGFKYINDSLGHPTGDKLLQSVAARLSDCVREVDTVSRPGGDEFVVLLSEMERPEDAAAIAIRMLETVARPHALGDYDIHITASIGVSVFPEDGLDAETLIKNADTAMYQAKEMGRETFRFFEAAMNAKAIGRQSLESSLRRALERDEMALHYQAKVSLLTGRITGAEALLRWTHPTRGAISPAQFIPIAEECGLIRIIGDWVLAEGCRQAKSWMDAGLALGSLAINVSAVQFADEQFRDRLFAILAQTGLDPTVLELEITESLLMKRKDATAGALQSIREKGVRIAIDDFGTGYSSLSYLQKFPVDVLKIDQSFVQQIGQGGHSTLVTAVIDMARALKLRVVAEGVETQAQVDFLTQGRCDEAQGYFFARPIPAEAFATLLATGMPVLLPGASGSSLKMGINPSASVETPSEERARVG